MGKLLFIVTLFFLAACGGIQQEAPSQPSEIPLITDEDYDNAQLQLRTEIKDMSKAEPCIP
ncbi:MAG: hypothetical protein KC422_19850 [Trueperaceae bacterium]|nr:hypothetical protein [Trueperaceae bacterium]